MKLHYLLCFLAVFFCEGSWADELSLVCIEENIYTEIDNLGIVEQHKREAESRECIQECSKLPAELIKEIDGWIGYAREVGPSYDSMNLSETQKMSWSVPLTPAVVMGLKSLVLPDYWSIDMGILCGSIFLGSFITWWCYARQKDLKKEGKMVINESIYDIESGYRYYPMRLECLIEQEHLRHFMSVSKKITLSNAQRKGN